jgi:hypothetical protein
MIGGLLDEAFGWQATFFCCSLGAGDPRAAWADQGETARAAATSFRAQARAVPRTADLAPLLGLLSSAAAFASGAFFAFLGGAPFVASEVYGLSPVWCWAWPSARRPSAMLRQFPVGPLLGAGGHQPDDPLRAPHRTPGGLT